MSDFDSFTRLSTNLYSNFPQRMQDCVQPSRIGVVCVLAYVSLTLLLLVLLLLFTVMEARRQLNRTRGERTSYNRSTEVEKGARQKESDA